MNRPWQVWSMFGVCLAVAIAGMAWLSHRVVDLERADALQNFQADFEGNVRLALRRMDLQISQLIAEQNAWPYLAYQPTYRPPSTGKVPAALIESPLRSPRSPLVKIYFELGPGHELRSPSVGPDSGERGSRSSSWTSADATPRHRLQELGKILDPPTLLVSCPPAQPWSSKQFSDLPPLPVATNAANAQGAWQGPINVNPPPLLPSTDQQAQLPPPPGYLQPLPQQQELNKQQGVAQGLPPQQFAQQMAQPAVQQARNEKEYQTRREGFESQIGNLTAQIKGREIYNSSNNYSPSTDSKAFSKGAIPPVTTTGGTTVAGATPPAAAEGLIQPVWFGNELVLARRVVLGDKTYIQGCWLDWDALKRTLAAGVSDLLPEMDLVPVHEDKAADPARNPGRMLATIPAELIAVPPAFNSSAQLSPVRLSLLAAWIGLGLASLAVAILLRGVLALSERRAAFVSAVTHELRTPLTTFRMYSEMLAEGMVQDESQQRHYLGTLKAEADRLFHLIENVLSYARLERGRRKTAGCTTSVGELIAPIAARLSERAGRDDMQVVLDLPQSVADRQLTTDAGAIEQVLVNLVDNACKYAAAADDRRIHLHVGVQGKWLRIGISDHGPGIAAAEARRLFRPFTKSASEAAQTAPGVGLGLALSRRLASELGGKLQFAPSSSESTGAAFVLVVRLEA